MAFVPDAPVGRFVPDAPPGPPAPRMGAAAIPTAADEGIQMPAGPSTLVNPQLEEAGARAVRMRAAPPTFAQKLTGAVEAALNTVTMVTGGILGAPVGAGVAIAEATGLKSPTGPGGKPIGLDPAMGASGQDIGGALNRMLTGPMDLNAAPTAPSDVAAEHLETKVGPAMEALAPLIGHAGGVGHEFPNMQAATRAAGDLYRAKGAPAARAAVGPKVMGALETTAPQAVRKLVGVDPELAKVAQIAGSLKYPIDVRPDQVIENAKFSKLAGQAAADVPLANSKRSSNQTAFTRNLIEMLNPEETKADRLSPDTFDTAMRRSGEGIGEITARTPIPEPHLVPQLGKAIDLSKATEDNRRIVTAYIGDIKRAAEEGGGRIDGTRLKEINSEIGKQARSNADSDLGRYLNDLQDVIQDAVERNASPKDIKALKDFRRQYAYGKMVEPLVAKTIDGKISPEGLMARVTATKQGKHFMARSMGGPIGDLAKVGKLIKEPGSSLTTERSLVYGAGLGGGAFIEPHTAAAAYGSALAYNTLGPKVTRALVGKKPAPKAPPGPPPDPTTSPGAGGGGGGGTPPRPGPLGDLTPDWQTTPGAGGGKPRGGHEPGLVRAVDETDPLPQGAGTRRPGDQIPVHEPAPLGDLTPDWTTEGGAGGPRGGGGGGEPGLHRAVGDPKPPAGKRAEKLQIPAVPGRPDLPDTVVAGPPSELALDKRTQDAMGEPAAVLARRMQTLDAEQRKPAEKLPVGEVVEDKPLPVGKVIEGQPEIKPLVPKKPLPVGKADELPVERIEPESPIEGGEVVDLTPEQDAAWRKEFGLGDGDAERAKAVAVALRHDAEAVEKAAVQLDNQPRAFDREIARITEEGQARANESQQAAAGSEGAPPAGDAAKLDTDPAAPAAGEQPRPDSDAAPDRGGEQAAAGGQAPDGAPVAAKSTKPRLGESADDVWKALQNEVVEPGRGILYPTARIVGGGGDCYGEVPLDAIRANEDGARYDSTVDMARAREYAERGGEMPPVLLVEGRSGSFNVNDGGHRVTAARLRGDKTISAVVGMQKAEAASKLEIRETARGFEAFRDGKMVGYLHDNLKKGQAEQLGENASVEMVKVHMSERGKREVGPALYKAFHDKHGGRIQPNGKTEPGAWKLWKREYPEKVEEFVQQEAKRIADGADKGLVLGNIKDAEVAQRVNDAAAKIPPKPAPVPLVPKTETADARMQRIRDTPPNQRTDADLVWAREQADAKRAEASDDAAATATADTNGFTDNLPPMQRGKVESTLGKLVRSDGRVMTRQQFIEEKVRGGLAPKTEQEDRIKPLSRMQFFRADGQQQAAHDAKVKAAGKKDVYYLGEFEVTKIEYDYAEHLIAKKKDAPDAVKGPELQTEAEFGEPLKKARIEELMKELAEVNSKPAASQFFGKFSRYKSRADAVRQIVAEMTKARNATPESFASDHLADINKAIAAGKTPSPENIKRYDLEAVHGKRLQPDDLQPAAGEKAAGKTPEPPEEIFSAEKQAPFYSPLGRAVDGLKMERAPAQGWLDAIKGMKGIKPEEIEWSGVREWLGTREGKVTKAELQAYLQEGGVKVEEVTKGSGGYEVGELDSLLSKWADEHPDTDAAKAIRQGHPWNSISRIASASGDREVVRMIDARHEGDVKYKSYQLPGGKNYREVLLTLPRKERPGPGFEEWLRDKYGSTNHWDAKNIFAARADYNKEFGPQGPTYKSPHWDEPNVLAHIRLNDRVDAEGRKVLFVEEVQSDWAQQGKKKGFGSKGPTPEERAAAQKELNDADTAVEELFQEGRAATASRKQLRDKYDRMLDESERHPVESRREEAKQALVELEKLRDKEADKSRGFSDRNLAAAERLKAAHEAMRELDRREAASKYAVPNAPFVGKTDAWTALAIKRVTKMAADEGYDRVAFINGEQSAARYDLSKHIDRIDYSKDGDGYSVSAIKSGEEVFSKEGMSDADLEETFGKDVAQKIVMDQGGPGEQAGRWEPEDGAPEYKTLRGVDLKVGGEGMKAFYDKIVPNVAKDVVKKLGGDGLTTSEVTSGDKWEAQKRAVAAAGGHGPWEHLPRSERGRRIEEEAAKGAQTQVAFDITPQMRENAAGGVPLFKGEEPGQFGGKPARSPEELEGWLREDFSNKMIDGLKAQGLIKYALALDEGRTREKGEGGVKAVLNQKRGEQPAATFYFDRITRERAAGLMMHELGEHFGAPRMLGERRYALVMDELKELAGTEPEVKEAWQHVKDNYTGEGTPNKIKEGDDTFMREVAAHLVETQPQLSWVRRLVNEIRAFLYEQFGTSLGNRVDANLIRGMAAAALRKAATGGLAGQQPTPRQFKPFVPSSRQPTPSQMQ